MRRFVLFSIYDIQPIKILDIFESVPGAENIDKNDSSRTFTILGKSGESSDSRIIVVKCLTNDHRNTLLTGLR